VGTFIAYHSCRDIEKCLLMNNAGATNGNGEAAKSGVGAGRVRTKAQRKVVKTVTPPTRTSDRKRGATATHSEGLLDVKKAKVSATKKVRSRRY